MDAHGLTWTNTFIHARRGMNKTPDAFGMVIYNKETATLAAAEGVFGA